MVRSIGLGKVYEVIDDVLVLVSDPVGSGLSSSRIAGCLTLASCGSAHMLCFVVRASVKPTEATMLSSSLSTTEV